MTSSEPENESIRLYRFMSAESAFMSIENRLLRVGRIADFNDPLEGLPGVDFDGYDSKVTGNYRKIEQDMEGHRDIMSANIGVICFCATANEHLLWSHYANHHNGIALGFDVPIREVIKMEYNKPRPCLKFVDGEIDIIHSEFLDGYLVAKECLKRKSTSWSYEEEYRIVINFSECLKKQDDFFMQFSQKKLNLSEVIIGMKSKVTSSYLHAQLLKNGFEGVQMHRASTQLGEYSMSKISLVMHKAKKIVTAELPEKQKEEFRRRYDIDLDT